MREEKKKREHSDSSLVIGGNCSTSPHRFLVVGVIFHRELHFRATVVSFPV
jgi:hypothetical protein